jgi:DNA-binding PadR family transcriptional regulator
MVLLLDAPRAVGLPGFLPARDTMDELLQLMVLRLIEDAGPLSGNDALNELAPLVCSLDTDSPRYPLLHDLRDAGFLDATRDRPPRYAVTDAGRLEAERLAARCWPAIVDALAGLNVCIGCLAPRSAARPAGRPTDRW